MADITHTWHDMRCYHAMHARTTPNCHNILTCFPTRATRTNEQTVRANVSPFPIHGFHGSQPFRKIAHFLPHEAESYRHAARVNVAPTMGSRIFYFCEAVPG
jgi:hypothetical protein